MDKKVLLVKNISREGPGILLDLLGKYGIYADTVDLNTGEKFPETKGYAAVFVFGGPDSANDKTEKMVNELKRIRETVEAEIPYFGFCLGMQVLVKASGGTVVKSKIREIGFKDPGGQDYEIEKTADGLRDPVLEKTEKVFKIFQLHGETVKLTPRIRLLATGRDCLVQMVKTGKNAYGLQGHPELTETMFDKWLAEDDDLKNLDKEKLRKDYKSVKKEYEKNGRQILINFLKIAGVI